MTPIPPLGPGEVHVWRAAVAPDAFVRALEALLSSEELARARRFHFEKDAARFVTGRATARCVIAAYLGVEPGEIRFFEGAHGKPLLPDAPGLHFNWSHAGDVVAVAVASAEVGVDVERTERITDLDAVAERVFSERELDEYRALEGDARRIAFFNGWTRKEAFIKATGEGMTRPLKEFDVTLAHAPVRLQGLRGGDDDVSRWSLHAFAPGDGYAGAVAVRAPAVRLHVLHWSGGGD
jgi:4'-phosphopantetheinyl transferase